MNVEAALIGPTGRTTLTSSVVTLGRAASNSLVVQDVKASSHHAEIRPEGQGYIIVDLGSTNGTFVNEQKIAPNTPQMLNANDSIRIGDTRFTYEAPLSTQAATVFDNALPPQNGNPSYLPTMAAPPPMYSSAPDQNQNANYLPTMAAPSPYTDYQSTPLPPPPGPAQDYPPYTAAPSYYSSYQQPAPAPSAPSTRERGRKNSRFRLYAIGAGIALLLIAGVIVAVAVSNASSPTKTLTDFCTDYKAGNFSAAYDLFSSNLQGQISRAQFVSSQTQASNQVGGVIGCTVSNVAESDPSATGIVTFTATNGQTFVNHDKLVDQNGTWKIDNVT
jgi:pSer/pThr/pTyr-binding forkhead associated (FHA) protein